jgi:hypothetical protein
MLPDLARWQMQIPAEPGVRWVSYRRGEEVFDLRPDQARSLALHGLERDDLLLRLELRRALFSWPQGFEWSGDGSERRAQPRAAGTLVAELDGQGLLLSLRSVSATGAELERYRVLGWRESGSRRWPAKATLSFGGEEVWKEELIEATTSVRYLDSYFLPVDRREPGGRLKLPFGQLEHADLPAMVVRRVELQARPTLEQAFLAAVSGWKEAREALQKTDASLEARIHIELGEDGAPKAYLQRLKAVPLVLPDGWSRVEARPALTLLLQSEPAEARALLRAVLAAVPEDARPGVPYLTAPLRDGFKGALQLVVPLAPRGSRE